MDTLAWFWLILGGVLEPIWVITLKKTNSFKHKGWTLTTVFFMMLSPYFLGLSMSGIPLGTAYAVWTGIGAIGALIAGYLVYDEAIERVQILFVFVIIAGAVGLQFFGGI
ncbi:MAG: DMT family transporter [Candidatus Methanomethylophilaceae archaeon]|jgi:quaternary ammonium compound-resistance protein SugE